MAIWQRRAPCEFTNTVTVTGVTTLTGNTGLTPGAGAPGKGSGGTYNSWREIAGGVIKTSILVDLTGCTPAGGLHDAIGVVGSDPAHVGQVTTALCGTLFAGRMTVIEDPNGQVDIDLRSNTSATIAENGDASAATSALLVEKAASWAQGSATMSNGFTALPAADTYLYLSKGAESSVSAYTAGKFLIELWGSA